ncbi:J domain-containing protein [Lacisediminihabitans sp. FW035]
MSMTTTHYETLGVDPLAVADEIKTAYRRLIRVHHPDLVGSSPESEATTRQLTEAYDTLSDPAGRREYARSLLHDEPEPEPRVQHQEATQPPAYRTPTQPQVPFSPVKYKVLSRTAIVSGFLTTAMSSTALWYTFAGPEGPFRPVIGILAFLPIVITVTRRAPWPLLVAIGLGCAALPLYLAGVWPGTALVDDAQVPVAVLALIPAHAIAAAAFRLTVQPAWAQRRARPKRQ